MASKKPQPCRICSKLPETLIVDTDKGESIPAELDKLNTVCGHRVDAFGEIRECSLCHQFYRYWYSHEATTGGGLGWSEHTLKKISEEQALEQKHESAKSETK